MKKILIIAFVLIISLGILQSCQQPSSTKDTTATSSEKPTEDSVAQHLKTFDELDFDVYSNQKFDRLHESHAQNIKVFWPDGHITEGLEAHIADMKKMFVFAPDARIKEHPIRIGTGNHTAVTGVYEGTFTKPMPIGNGKFIQPTGKAFKFPMCTVGVWENGVMVEEHLFWDNETFSKQIGLQ